MFDQNCINRGMVGSQQFVLLCMNLIFVLFLRAACNISEPSNIPFRRRVIRQETKNSNSYHYLLPANPRAVHILSSEQTLTHGYSNEGILALNK